MLRRLIPDRTRLVTPYLGAIGILVEVCYVASVA